MASYYYIDKRITKIYLNGVSKEECEQNVGKLYDTKEEAEKNFNSDPRLQKCIEASKIIKEAIKQGDLDELEKHIKIKCEKTLKEIGE